MFSGNLPDDYRQDAGLREWKGTELKGKEAEAPPRPNIFSVYESEIGPLTPMIAEELEAAVGDFTESWVEDAIHEAAVYGARSWAYCRSILQARKAGRSKPRKSGAGGRELTPDQERRGQKPEMTAAELVDWKRAQAERRRLEQGANLP